jgi:asparagine synthase (glutamine-hydrolysing)
VKQRIERGKIAAHLSGGIDSSSVVCVARNLFASGWEHPNLEKIRLRLEIASIQTKSAYADLI